MSTAVLTRDSANDLVWDEGSQSYVPASDPPTPTEYTCNRDTTIDIYEEGLDPDTVYNVTDQQDNFINIIRDTIWPVGSIYFGMMETCPLAALFGTWVKISAGRVIQGADETNPAGTTKEAGLPNITGEFGVSIPAKHGNTVSGAFRGSTLPGGDYNSSAVCNDTANPTYGFTIDASRSSEIYGASDTVQPPALCVNIWQRVA